MPAETEPWGQSLRSSVTRPEQPAPNGANFEAVYAEHFPFVWRCLRALGVPSSGLDDGAQDVFLVVFRRLPTFQGQATLRSWLYGIVRNVASNHRRSRRRKGLPQPLPASEPVHPGPGPVERAQEREAAAFIEGFLRGLRERKRDVFILAVLEEMSIPEVAAALSVPLNTAYTRLRSVRADFQRALSRHRGEP